MKKFAFQTRIVRTETPTPTIDPVTGRSTMDPVMLHTIAKAQVEHAAKAVIVVVAAVKFIDVASKIAIHIATTKI